MNTHYTGKYTNTRKCASVVVHENTPATRISSTYEIEFFRDTYILKTCSFVSRELNGLTNALLRTVILPTSSIIPTSPLALNIRHEGNLSATRDLHIVPGAGTKGCCGRQYQTWQIERAIQPRNSCFNGTRVHEQIHQGRCRQERTIRECAR